MISPQEFQQRRMALAQNLEPNSIALIASNIEINRNGDTTYRFHQSSNFYYLTGFNEPDALLVIYSSDNPACYLFNRPNNPAAEQWTGKRLGQADAVEQLNVDDAFSIDTLATKLPELMANKGAVYYDLSCRYQTGVIRTARKSLKNKTRQGITPPAMLIDIEPILGELRLIKSAAEIELMKKAAQISVAAHRRAMKTCHSKKIEYELEAELMSEMIHQGCRHVAYEAIVGGGKNGCTLHYVDNNAPLVAGELVLIDAGGEYQGYAADITRTFPINGRFSEPQKALYELVLKAQKAGINCIKPGIEWSLIQVTMVNILTTGLCELGLLTGDVHSLIEAEAYKRFYMHSSGHWLGLDVHDCGVYKIDNQWRELKAGMVLTVEPGLYIAPAEDISPCWWNIGIRIEDDILVTATGHENLTAGLPVDIAEIEALMRDY